MKHPLVQILVVVANIQMQTLKTEVEKGSMWTVIVHGLVDPKVITDRKGIGLIFPNQDVDIMWQHKWTRKH